MEFLQYEKSQNYIYLIDMLGRVETISPRYIRIHGIKNSFTLPEENSFAATYVENIRDKSRFFTLIPKNLVTQIDNGTLWGDIDQDLDQDILIFTTNINNEFISKCTDSGLCIALGQYTKQIYNYFLGFTQFNLVSNVKKISEYSANGFLYQISYEHDGYTAKSILKSSKIGSADNLLYEYLVGQYINKQCLIFPCFIQTYGWFKYKTERFWEQMSDGDGRITSEKLTLGMTKGEDELKTIPKTNHCFRDKKDKSSQRRCTKLETLLGFACTNSKYLAILIENVEGKTLKSKMIDSPPFVSNDLLYVLYQVYMPLATLADEYTHYDLHTSNVLVYELDGGKYINYRYEYTDGSIVEFKSKYIAKIIDYGRSYFNDSQNDDISGSSTKIYKNICDNVNDCTYQQRFCGEIYGFLPLSKSNTNYVRSSIGNVSYDLLLLKRVSKLVKDVGITVTQEIKNFIKVESEEESQEKYRNTDPNKIENIFDAHNVLRKLVIEKYDANNANYDEFEALASLTIYESRRPMEFTLKTRGNLSL